MDAPAGPELPPDLALPALQMWKARKPMWTPLVPSDTETGPAEDEAEPCASSQRRVCLWLPLAGRWSKVCMSFLPRQALLVPTCSMHVVMTCVCNDGLMAAEFRPRSATESVANQEFDSRADQASDPTKDRFAKRAAADPDFWMQASAMCTGFNINRLRLQVMRGLEDIETNCSQVLWTMLTRSPCRKRWFRSTFVAAHVLEKFDIPLHFSSKLGGFRKLHCYTCAVRKVGCRGGRVVSLEVIESWLKLLTKLSIEGAH